MQMGPPSEYAKARKMPYAVLLAGLSVCIALRIYPMLDIMGGFINAIGIGLGWYAVHRDMDIQFVCYCGMLCLINGIFDTVRMIDMLVKMGGAMDIFQDIIMLTMLASPALMLATAGMSYYIYKD